MTLSHKFNVGQYVYVPSLGKTTGRILFMSFNGCQIEYKLRYASNGEFKEVWFYEDELSII